MKTHKRRQSTLATLQGWLFISPWLIGFIFFAAGPILFSMLMSFTRWSLLSPPQWIGIGNYQEILFDDPLVYKSLWNTAYYVLFAVPLGVGLSLALALLLNQKLKGMNIFRTIYFLPSVTNLVAISILWLWIFNPEFGLLNRALSWIGIDGPLWLQSEVWSKPALILMSLWGIGGGMIINLAALQSIPQELYEAADLDGAQRWRKTIHITLPLISPAIFFNLVMNIIGSFQVFTQAFVMTASSAQGQEGGPNNSTLFFVLYLYKKAFQQFQMGYASALAWILFIIILIFTIVQFSLSRRWVYYESGDIGA
ncbi:MAG: sugar ABC transporter permease [bacterium]|jgi:multiple sugar transport system permease protein|nr:sugar ABC transporter permease [bacterium]